jgi:Rad3-related DNA helicase
MGLQDEIQMKRKLLILDECHSVESKLLDFASVIIDRKQCKNFDLYDAILDFPDSDASEEEKFNWLLNIVYPQLVEEHKRISVIFESMTEMDSDFNSIFRKINHLQDMNCKIANIRDEYNTGKPCAVLQDSDKSIKFKPIFGKSLAPKFLLPFCSKTLSMSATVLSKDQYCRDMGFRKEETMFIKLPSLFPVENRPIYSLGIGSMTYKEKTKTIPKIAETVKLILEKHKNDRGIIHTVNYEVAEYLITFLKSSRLIMPRGKTRDSEIEYFLNSKKNDLVLISPSLQEGIDLKDDLSRFTIVCKTPYASLKDDWVKKRMELSPKWYSEQTLMNLIQMTGRSVRTESDHAVAYILDSNFNTFFKQNKNKFLKWWSESVIIK